MKLAAFVLYVKAKSNGRLPQFCGRLLHAALLSRLQQDNPQLSALLHDAENKSFSASVINARTVIQKGFYLVEADTAAYWRFCIMGDYVDELLAFLQPGISFRLGNIEFVLQKVVADQKIHSLSGITSTEFIEAACEKLPALKRVTISFSTPTTFRSFDQDYPLPRADLVFGSLADRWNRVSGQEHFNVELVKKIAADNLVPERWLGQTRYIKLSAKLGVNCFVGSFSYKLSLLPQEYQAIFIMLAEFARFSGVGRLTAQGFGQVEISYE